jgi:hypothetical protein
VKHGTQLIFSLSTFPNSGNISEVLFSDMYLYLFGAYLLIGGDTSYLEAKLSFLGIAEVRKEQERRVGGSLYAHVKPVSIFCHIEA